MHNANKPTPDDLPSTVRLVKSTVIAAVAAVVILITVVLPSEYGIDPTGVGKKLGLAEMGEIKVQLHEEAEADRQMERLKVGADEQSSLGDAIFGIFFGAAHAQTADAAWTDEMSVTLKPGEGTEVKLVMDEGAVAEFAWVVAGGVVNYDLHGDGSGQNVSYEKGRALPGHEGTLTAAFTGNHGWFWRNRGSLDVTVTLFVRGGYSAVNHAN